MYLVMAMNLFSSPVETGTPATVSIGGDSYPGSVVASSPSGKTVTVALKSGDMTFKFSAKAGCYKSGKSYFLALGVAESKWDPSF
jgi:hypothetical protein